jgi:hypothetical protein
VRISSTQRLRSEVDSGYLPKGEYRCASVACTPAVKGWLIGRVPKDRIAISGEPSYVVAK